MERGQPDSLSEIDFSDEEPTKLQNASSLQVIDSSFKTFLSDKLLTCDIIRRPFRIA